MDFIHITIPTEKAYVLPIGDIHFGDRSFGKKGRAKLLGNLNWLRDNEHQAVGVLMGDIYNIAGRDTKTSPFTNNPDEITEAEDFFRPYSDLFKVAIRGNHERRLVNNYGFDPLKGFCKHLNIPYGGVSALLRIQVGAREDSNSYWNTYNMAIHHTTGGGGKLGNALSGVLKLAEVVPGCDVYAGGHNHQLVTGVQEKLRPTLTGPKPYKAHYVSCGSYLEYEGSYAEEGMYIPGKLGSPRIRFSGVREKHDVHVSI